MPLPDLLKLLTPAEQDLLGKLISGKTLWMPHPDNIPQMQAYVSEADVLYFGGAAGGGKTDLLLGLSMTAHRKSIIFRREYTQIRELVDRSTELLGHTKARYNQTSSRWAHIPGDRILEFGGVKQESDKEKFKGRPHDLKAFDEIPDFSESQFRFLSAWNRTTITDQRCRIVCAGNPPTHAEGEWVIRYWAPWLSENHPNPAKPGELRWFASLDGRDREVEDGSSFEYKGEQIRPLSRTFIPSLLENNPYLRNTTYRAVLQSLPEPLRSHLLHGLFSVARADPPRQVIPTEWIKLAQKRWRDTDPPEEIYTSVGLDPSRGGVDETVIAPMTGNYFWPLLAYPGIGVPNSEACVALVMEALGEVNQGVKINVDVIGIGSAVFDALDALDFDVAAINFARKSGATDKSGNLAMQNIRSEAYWTFREALDPVNGEGIALPPDDELAADLAAPTWGMSPRGVKVERKVEIRKRLGRSPGKGDAVVLAHFVENLGVLFR